MLLNTLLYCALSPAEHLDGVAVQHAAALAPVIAGMQEEITVLKRELEQQRVQAAVTQQELDGMTNRLNEVRWQNRLLLSTTRVNMVFCNSSADIAYNCRHGPTT